MLLAVPAVAARNGGHVARQKRQIDPDRKERRERILAEAATLIAKHGYLGVNLSDIGAAAGIVGSGIYRHFDSKVAILVELFDRVVDRLVDDAEACLRDTDRPETILAVLVRGQVRFTMGERALCEVYLQEARSLPAQDSRRLRWKMRHYVDLWQEALASVRADLPPAKIQVLVHAAISTIHSPLRYRGHLSDSELATFLEEVACSMLGVEPLALDADPGTDVHAPAVQDLAG
jgi:AcrR family transcriptional regulator